MQQDLITYLHFLPWTILKKKKKVNQKIYTETGKLD